jgi:hypothetical protein
MRKIAGRNGGTLNVPEKGEFGGVSGRKKGYPNRETVARRWLDVLTKTKNPVTGIDEPGTIEDKVMLSLIQKALKGDPRAIELVFEMKYGKMMQPVDLQVDTIREIQLIQSDGRVYGEISSSEDEVLKKELPDVS